MRRLSCYLAAVTWLLSATTAHAICGAGLYFYQKGNDGWYYHGEKIAADSESFHVLPEARDVDFFNPCTRDSGYAADQAHVYRGTTVLAEADPKTFALLTNTYSRDATHVYFFDRLLKGADAKTFVRVGHGYFKDSKSVYLEGVVVANAEPQSFRVLGDEYTGVGLARDATHVFFGRSTVVDADPANVKILGRQYWRSHNRTFSADKRLMTVDDATFAVAGPATFAFSAQDRERYFLGDRVVAKRDCTAAGDLVLACKDFILAVGKKYSELDSASLHYLGRFPPRCSVIEGSSIYQDRLGFYEVYSDGTILKFTDAQSSRTFEGMEETVQALLCGHPTTSMLKMPE